MSADRRTILAGGLSSAVGAALRTGDTTASEYTAADPVPTLRGSLDSNIGGLREVAEDFGHILHAQPLAVLKPASVADIVDMMRWAGGRGLRVAARGRGHSTYGRAMTRGGIVIDMSTMNRIHSIEHDRIVVEAGATWRSVLDAAASQGLMPPVLTNYLGLSVGGTLAVGGIGGMTTRHGMQTDNVLELEVVTGDGRELTCSAIRNSDLFDAVRGGLGQCAVITRATLRLVPAPERVLRFQLFYPDLASLSTDQRFVLAEDRFDQLQGAVVPDGGNWRYQLEGAVFYDSAGKPDRKAMLAGLSYDRDAAVVSDLTFHEDASAFDRLETLLRSNGQWSYPHPWLLTFLRGSDAEHLAATLLQGLTPKDVGSFGRIIYYPILTNALRTPLVRLPNERTAFCFNLIRFPETSGATDTERMIADNRTLYERVRAAGGVLYPVSAFPMHGADWKSHFGPSWPILQDAKVRYDPSRILTPGYDVF